MKHFVHHAMLIVVCGIWLVILAATVHDLSMSYFPRPTAQSLASGAWTQQLESYLRERIGFRDSLFRLRSRTDLFVGEKMVQGVYVTDGMLLEKQDESTADALDLAEPVNTFYQAFAMPTYFVLIPSAAEIYESVLPANAVSADQESLIRNIYDGTASGVRCVDARSVLASCKDGYIYYRTDTHCTSYAGYYLYQAVIQKLGFTPVPYERFVISHLSTDFRGNLYHRTLCDTVRPDVIDRYSNEAGVRITGVQAVYQDGTTEDRGTQLSAPSALAEDPYRYYLGQPCMKLTITTDADNGKRLLLYKDDYADCVVPFLLQHYSEICIVNLEQTGDAFTEAAAPEAYTQVLFLSSIRRWQELWE